MAKMVDKATGLVKSPFTITGTTTGTTFATTDFATSTVWTQVMSYAVPLGMAVEITPVNWHFASYYNTGGTTITAGQTRILKKNANGTEARELWSGPNAIFGDISDVRKRPNIRVPVVANASEQIVVEVYSLGVTLDVSASNYYIEAMQWYSEV